MENSKIKTYSYVTIIAATILVAAFVLSTNFRTRVRSTTAYWYVVDNIAMPMMRKIDPEKAHNLTVALIKNNYAPIDSVKDPESLQTSVFGLNFSNPIGVAAGLDKQAQAMQGLLNLGFGFVEVGGVTPEPQTGNPKPRMFRLPEDQAIINRYGLNSEGQAVIASRLATFKQRATPGVIGVNIAKNTTSEDIIGDYKKGVRNLGGNVDFIVLNVSCPNVAWTKELSNKGDELAKMVCAVKEERESLPVRPALLMKLGPDMSPETMHHMADIATNCGVDGLIISNTTSERSPDLKSKYSKETGGLSGRPIKQTALNSVREMYKITHGKIPIIGVGGIESGQDAYDRIRAGASLLEIYTALIYKGPGLVPQIKRDLAMLLQRDGFKSVADAVGVDAQQGQ